MATPPSTAVTHVSSLQLKPSLSTAPPILANAPRPPAVCAASGNAAAQTAEAFGHGQPRRRRTRRAAAAVLDQRIQQQEISRIQGSTREEPDDGVNTPWDLTSAIQGAQNRQQLHSICKRHRTRMNYIHAAAAITKLAKLHPSQQHPSQGKLNHSRLSPPLPHQQQQQQQQQQQGPSPDDHRCITDIAYLVATHCAEFQPRALANALWAVSKLAIQLQQEEHTFQQQQQQQQQQQEPRSFLFQLSPPDQSALTAVLDLAACLCSYLPQLAPGLEPQHCANTLHALASLQQVYTREKEQLQQLQLRNEGAAKPVRLQNRKEWQQNTDEQQHRLQQLQQVLACAPLALHATDSSKLAGMVPQGLANSLHAVARLQLLPEEAWLDAWLDEAQAKLPHFEPQHISSALWALGKLGFYPGDDWLEAALQASLPKLPAFAPQGLALMLWALAMLQARPPQPLLLPILQLTHERVPSFCPQDASNVLWALAKLQPAYAAPSSESLPVDDHTSPQQQQQQQQQQTALDSLVAAVVQQVLAVSVRDPQAMLSDASPQDLAISTWAVSCLRPLLQHQPHRTSSYSKEGIQSHHTPPPSPIPPATNFHLLLPSHPSPHARALVCAWLGWVIQASQPKLPHFSSQELSNLLLSLARLSHPPNPHLSSQALDEEWWTHVAHVSCLLMPSAHTQHVVNTLWAVAVLGRKPHAKWARALCRKVLAEREHLSAQSLAMTLWALARLRLQPGRLWLHSLLAPHSPLSKRKAAAAAAAAAAERLKQIAAATPDRAAAAAAAAAATAAGAAAATPKQASAVPRQKAGPGQWMTRDHEGAYSPEFWLVGPGYEWAEGMEVTDANEDDGGRDAAESAEMWEGAGLKALAMSLWALPRLGLLAKPQSHTPLARIRAELGGPNPAQAGLISLRQQQRQQKRDAEHSQTPPGQQQQQQQQDAEPRLTPLQIRQLAKQHREQELESQLREAKHKASLIEDRLRNDAELMRPLLVALHHRLSAELQQVGQRRRQLRRQQQLLRQEHAFAAGSSSSSSSRSSSRSSNRTKGAAIQGDMSLADTRSSSSSSSSSSNNGSDSHSLPSSHAWASPAEDSTVLPASTSLHAHLAETTHAVGVIVRALGRLNSHGFVAPMLSHALSRTLDDACVMCMPHFGGVALSAVMGGLARLGHRPSPLLSAAAMRRASALVPSEVCNSLQHSTSSSSSSKSSKSSGSTDSIINSSSDSSRSRGSSKGLEDSYSRSGSARVVSVESVAQASGGSAHPGDLLTPWQLVVVLHSLASMRCPATRQWVLGMVEAWKALRLGVIKGGARDEARLNPALEDDLLSDDDLDGVIVDEVQEVQESAKRELGALLQVVRTFNLPRSVLENVDA